MKVSYGDEDVEALCRHEKVAVRKLGQACAKKLQRRLSDLHAAHVVAELPAGRPRPLKGVRAGQLALDLHGGARLILRPTANPPPFREDGSIDWSQVSDITIIEIGDYHD